MTFLNVFTTTVSTLLTFLGFLLIARVILSIFSGEEGLLFSFVYVCTEPVIIPVRRVLNNSTFFSSLPIDLTYVVTYMIITLVQLVLMIFK